MTERELQDRTEANEASAKDHVDLARMGKEQAKKEAPGIDEHDAAGQGLSG